MKKKLMIFFCIASLPFLSMIVVNEFLATHPRTHKIVEDKCSWHCHDVGCSHWEKSYNVAPSKTKQFHKNVFQFYVSSLKQNKLGLDYRSINLIVFILLYPLLGSLLLWNIIRRLV